MYTAQHRAQQTNNLFHGIQHMTIDPNGPYQKTWCQRKGGQQPGRLSMSNDSTTPDILNFACSPSTACTVLLLYDSTKQTTDTYTFSIVSNQDHNKTPASPCVIKRRYFRWRTYMIPASKQVHMPHRTFKKSSLPHAMDLLPSTLRGHFRRQAFQPGANYLDLPFTTTQLVHLVTCISTQMDPQHSVSTANIDFPPAILDQQPIEKQHFWKESQCNSTNKSRHWPGFGLRLSIDKHFNTSYCPKRNLANDAINSWALDGKNFLKLLEYYDIAPAPITEMFCMALTGGVRTCLTPTSF